jgi:hypothetical protein
MLNLDYLKTTLQGTLIIRSAKHNLIMRIFRDSIEGVASMSTHSDI